MINLLNILVCAKNEELPKSFVKKFNDFIDG